MSMQRKASYKIFVTRREQIWVGDEPDHCLMLTSMEGEPLNYTPGAAGEFVMRRSVTFHDRRKGAGPMQGYAITSFENGSVYSRFEGNRDTVSKVTKGVWTTYRGTGVLKNIKGKGTFTVKATDVPSEFVLEMEGEYEL